MQRVLGAPGRGPGSARGAVDRLALGPAGDSGSECCEFGFELPLLLVELVAAHDLLGLALLLLPTDLRDPLEEVPLLATTTRGLVVPLQVGKPLLYVQVYRSLSDSDR